MLNSYIEFFETGDYKHFEEYQQQSIEKCQNVDIYLGWEDSHLIRKRFIVFFNIIYNLRG